MSVTPNFFTGTVDGEAFVAVHALGEDAQLRAGVAIDLVSPINDGPIPQFGGSNWLFRPVAEGANAETILSDAGEVHEVGEVNAEAVAKYVGVSAMKKAFRA